MGKFLSSALSLTMIAGSAPALAQTPSALGDLVGARAAGGETQLEARGYVHIKTEKGDDRAWSYWWQPSRRECVSVAVIDGRFGAITTTPAPDCNQKMSGNRSDATGAANYARPVKLNDLWTMRASAADVELQRRGFRTVNAYQAGETAYTIRSNQETGQCVQVAVNDGRVRYISPVKKSACR